MITTARLCTPGDGVMHQPDHGRCVVIEFEGKVNDFLNLYKGALYVEVETGTYPIDCQQFLDAVHELLA